MITPPSRWVDPRPRLRHAPDERRPRLKKGPAFLLVAPDRERRAQWKELLGRHGEVRAFTSLATAQREATAGHRPFLAFVLDVDEDGRSLLRLLTLLRRSAPRTPGLVVSEGPARSAAALHELGFRSLPRAAPAAEGRYFVGYCLALEVSGNPHVAAAVEALGRSRALTPKQMELTAVSTLDIDRDRLAEGLGVSANTLKTRVRQLLRVHHEESLDALGKSVLRRALELASAMPWGTSPGSVRTPEGRGALPAERGATPRPAPPKKRRRRR